MATRRTLSTAFGDAEVALAGVGGVGAGVVLDGAAALESGTLVHEGSTVHGEGTLGVARVNDSRGGTSKVAGEGLDVVARGLGIVVILVLAAHTTPGAAWK